MLPRDGLQRLRHSPDAVSTAVAIATAASAAASPAAAGPSAALSAAAAAVAIATAAPYVRMRRQPILGGCLGGWLRLVCGARPRLHYILRLRAAVKLPFHLRHVLVRSCTAAAALRVADAAAALRLSAAAAAVPVALAAASVRLAVSAATLATAARDVHLRGEANERRMCQPMEEPGRVRQC